MNNIYIITTTERCVDAYIGHWINDIAKYYNITLVASGFSESFVKKASPPLQLKKLAMTRRGGWMRQLIALFLFLRREIYLREEVTVCAIMPKAWVLSSIVRFFLRDFNFIPYFTGLPSLSFKRNSARNLLFKCIEWYVGVMALKIIFDSPSQKAFYDSEFPKLSDKTYATFSLGGIGEIGSRGQIVRKKISNKRENCGIKIGHIGRLCERKGTLAAIEIFRDLMQENDSVKCLIEGPVESKRIAVGAMKLATDFPSQCIFKDSYHEDIQNLLQTLDILVAPSKWEGFGIIPAMAARLGVVVVAYNVIGLRDIVVPGKTGFLVEVCDRQEMIDAVTLLINNGELRKKFSDAGKQELKEATDKTTFVKTLVEIISN